MPHLHHEASAGTDGREHWALGVVAGAIAIAALVAGVVFGDVHGPSIDDKLIAWISAAVVLVAGAIAVTRISWALSHLVAKRSSMAAAGPVRVLTAIVGYLFVALAVLASLEASINHLLVGAGIVGIVLGIAAQQSLANVFAGVVMLMARPFAVGDRIRIRSGALGGVFDASVRELSLTYVTLYTEDGLLKIPNAAMLAAGIGQVPPRAEPNDAEDGEILMPE